MPRFLTLILSFILILSSCTIEKRTFNRGYHVSWNRKVTSTPPGNRSTFENELAENEIKSDSKAVEEEGVLTDIAAKDQQLNLESIESPEPRQQTEQLSEEDFILAKNPVQLDDTVYIYPKFEPRGIASFATSLAAYGGFFIGIFFWELLIYISFGLLIAGLILGLLSLTEYGRNKIFYRKNVFGIIGTCLSGAPILFWMVLLLIEEFF